MVRDGTMEMPDLGRIGLEPGADHTDTGAVHQVNLGRSTPRRSCGDEDAATTSRSKTLYDKQRLSPCKCAVRADQNMLAATQLGSLTQREQYQQLVRQGQQLIVGQATCLEATSSNDSKGSGDVVLQGRSRGRNLSASRDASHLEKGGS